MLTPFPLCANRKKQGIRCFPNPLKRIGTNQNLCQSLFRSPTSRKDIQNFLGMKWSLKIELGMTVTCNTKCCENCSGLLIRYKGWKSEVEGRIYLSSILQTSDIFSILVTVRLLLQENSTSTLMYASVLKYLYDGTPIRLNTVCRILKAGLMMALVKGSDQFSDTTYSFSLYLFIANHTSALSSSSRLTAAKMSAG